MDYLQLDLNILRNTINEQLADEALSAISRIGKDAIDRPDAIGQTPLMALIRQWEPGDNKARVLGALLHAGADPNIPNRLGQTVLYWASRTGDVRSVSALLARNAAVDVQTTTGDTALMISVIMQRDKVVPMLLQAHADPLIENAIGKTAASMSENCGSASIRNCIRVVLASNHETEEESSLVMAA